MRRRKPVNQQAAMADGVDYLLRKFKALDRPTGVTGVGSTATGGGPIDPTYLVASANARDRIKAVADFVCSGDDDQVEIQAAINLAADSWLDGGQIVLTEGYFNCSDYIEMSTIDANIRIVGMGMFETIIVSSGDPGTMRDGLVSMNGDKSSFSHLQVDCDHPNYRCAIAANARTAYYGTPTFFDHVYMQLGTGATDGRAAMELYQHIAVDRCVVRSAGNGIYMWGDSSIVTNSTFVDTGTVNGTDGAAIHLGTASQYVRAEGNYIEPACVLGILAEGSDSCLIFGNYSESEIQLKTGSNNHLLVGNYSDITIDSGATDNAVYANYGTVTDNGTDTVLGAVEGAYEDSIVFTRTGTLADATTGTTRVYTKTARTITSCFAAVAGTPVTNPAVFDVHLDGTTIYTTQANRPDVAASAYVGDEEIPDVTAWAAGSYLTVDVDTASSATDLTLTVQYTEA